MPAPAPVAPAPQHTSRAAPLAGSYQRLTRLCTSLRVEQARTAHPAEGWTDSARLVAESGRLDDFVDGEAARIQAAHGHTARPDVAASRALHHYLWSVCLLLSGPWHLERRVPVLRPRDVHIEPVTGDFAVVPGEFTCLPDDPAAGSPGARVVSDEEALRAELRTATADHVRPLLTALAPRLRRGPRVLWGMAGDDLISGIWYLGRMLGDEDRSVRAATELLPGPVAPFPGGADFRRLRDAGGLPHTTRTRLGCCLYYTIRPDDACLTCPRLCDSERLERIAAPG
ncbi:iron-sulfur protein [Streptomyces agglomeratus]|uniref:(2Fe-2S)-binding protein n=1 Tax=Streptomyces agglomeratus TaxID=285458 RepID=UPI0008528323|nr:(2Fe-2S)-binding protein [Streptomyces agglomeratus]OEJ37608.1 iron-sulfur protein [Streptomyces agglomeratus]OEJ48006.1 iron-sulfur protein [Streptomyces agglomeratus]